MGNGHSLRPLVLLSRKRFEPSTSSVRVVPSHSFQCEGNSNWASATIQSLGAMMPCGMFPSVFTLKPMRAYFSPSSIQLTDLLALISLKPFKFSALRLRRSAGSLHIFCLDLIPIGIYTASIPSTRGRCHETSCWRGGMRRLRAGLVTPSPGGLGPPSAPTTRGRLHWLDAARTKAGESLPDRGPSRAPSAPGSYGPGDRNRRQISPDCASLSGWSAERRPHLPKRGCGTKDTGSA